MSRSILILLCALSSALCAFCAPLKEHRFPNGARLLVVESNQSNWVAIEIWVRAGTAYETDETSGVAHMLEHMIFKGSKQYPRGAIDRTLEREGAILEATTERDWARFSTVTPTAQWEEALRLILDHLHAPLLDAEELEREKGVVARHEYALFDSDPVKRMRQRLYAAAFQETPYARPVLGDRARVQSLERETLLRFHQRFYQPSKMLILLSGNVEMARAQPLLKSIWEQAAFPNLQEDDSLAPQPNRTFEQKRRAFIKEARNADRLIWITERTGRFGCSGLGIRVPEASSAEAVLAGLILKEILCDPVEGLFFQKKQEERLFRACVSDYLPRHLQGLITCVFEVESEHLDALEREASAIFSQLPNTLTLEQFQRAKSRLQAQQELLRRDLIHRTRQTALYECLELSDLSQDWQPELDKLTFEIFLRRLFPEVEPKDSVDAPTRTLPSPPKRGRELGSPQTRILANGMKILALPDGSEEGVYVNLFLRAGLQEERDFSPGIGALLAEMLFANSENETEGTMPYRIGQTTSRVQVYREIDYIRVEIHTTTERIGSALSLLVEGVFRAKFDSAGLRRARAALLWRQEHPKDQGYRLATEHARKALFSSHSLGNPIMGTPESIRAISLRELERFYKAYFQPDNALLAAGGAVDAETLQEAARTRFESLETKKTRSPISSEKLTLTSQSRFAGSGTIPADYMARARYWHEWTHEEYAAALVLSAMVGEGKGCILFQTLREELGFGYEVGSTIETWGEGLGFIAYAQYDPTVSQDTKGNAWKRFQEITPEPQDLERAKNMAMRRLNIERAMLSQRVRRDGEWELKGLGYDFDDRLMMMVKAVTWEEVLALWGKE